MATLLTKEQVVSNNRGSSNFTFKLEVIENSTNIANNASSSTINVYAKHNSGSGYQNISNPIATIKVDGVQKASVEVKTIYGSTYKLIASWTGDIEHNADGKKTANIVMDWYGGSNDVVAKSFSFNESVTLSNIARKSDFTASDAVVGGACNININRASNFTHTLLYSFGTLSGTIAAGIATNYGWTIPTTFYTKMSGKTATCTITCVTYNGNAEIGRVSKTVTISVNETLCKPDVAGTIEDINENTIALTGDSSKLIRYKSIAKITASGTAKNSATIKSLLVDNYNSPLIVNGVSKNSFTITAIDSRTIPNSIVKTAPIVNYIPLTCNALFERESQTSNKVILKYSGNYFNGNFGAIDNTLTLSWAYKLKGVTSWTTGGDITPTIENNTFSGNISCGSLFNYKKDYEFILYYSDKLDNLSISQDVTKGEGFEIYDKALMVNGDVLFHWENDKTEPGDWLKSIYPVGSIYLSVNSTNPSTLFGGTWQRFANGRVLVGVNENDSSFNAPQKTGGHKELQSHNHSFSTTTGGMSGNSTGRVGQVFMGTANPVEEGALSKEETTTLRTYSISSQSGNPYGYIKLNVAHTHSLNGTTNNAGNGNAGNLQPYITCYIWLRTA